MFVYTLYFIVLFNSSLPVTRYPAVGVGCYPELTAVLATHKRCIEKRRSETQSIECCSSSSGKKLGKVEYN